MTAHDAPLVMTGNPHGRRTMLLRNGERLAQVMHETRTMGFDGIADHAAKALDMILFQIMMNVGFEYPESDLRATEAMQRILSGEEFNSAVVEASFGAQETKPEMPKSSDFTGVKRPLGTTQIAVLKAMVQSPRGGKWWIGCGWVWNNPSETERILGTLVKRGLVEKEKASWTIGRTEVFIYTVTNAGRKAAK